MYNCDTIGNRETCFNEMGRNVGPGEIVTCT